MMQLTVVDELFLSVQVRHIIKTLLTACSSFSRLNAARLQTQRSFVSVADYACTKLNKLVNQT